MFTVTRLKNSNSYWLIANEKTNANICSNFCNYSRSFRLCTQLLKVRQRASERKKVRETPFLWQFFQGHCGLCHSYTECHSSAKWIVSLFVQAMGSRKTSLSPWTLPRGQLGQMSSSQHKGDGWPYSGPWSHIINSYKVLWFVNWIS